MTLEMDSEKHEINITYDPVHGLKIIGLKCPHERTLGAIKNHTGDFQYAWIISEDIGQWYEKLQKIIRGSEVD